MARDFLSEFGPERSDGGSRASSGGVTRAKELPYSPPQGPLGIMHKGVGLGGTNCGNAGTQNCDTSPRSSGSPGNHGTNRGMGTNRRG